jgi:hypothetical protein
MVWNHVDCSGNIVLVSLIPALVMKKVFENSAVSYQTGVLTTGMLLMDVQPDKEEIATTQTRACVPNWLCRLYI